MQSTAYKNWTILPSGIRNSWPGSCGPGCVGRFLPNGPLEPACKFHDFAYTVGGTKQDFYKVETDFRALLLQGLAECYFPFYKYYFWIAVTMVYAAMTVTWGRRLRRWQERPAPLSIQQIVALDEYDEAKETAYANQTNQ